MLNLLQQIQTIRQQAPRLRTYAISVYNFGGFTIPSRNEYVVTDTTRRTTGTVSIPDAICSGLAVILQQCTRPRALLSILDTLKPRNGDFIIVIPRRHGLRTPPELQKHPYYPVDDEFVVPDASLDEAIEYTTDLKEEKGHHFGEPEFYPHDTEEFLMVPIWIPRGQAA